MPKGVQGLQEGERSAKGEGARMGKSENCTGGKEENGRGAPGSGEELWDPLSSHKHLWVLHYYVDVAWYISYLHKMFRIQYQLHK